MIYENEEISTLKPIEWLINLAYLEFLSLDLAYLFWLNYKILFNKPL